MAACTDTTKPNSALLDYMKILYKGLRQSFASYSEHMILYYLYKRPGINGIFSTKHLIEVCGLADKTWKKSAALSATDVKSTGGTTEADEPVVKIQTPDSSFAEHIKCSTMQTVGETKKGIDLLELPSVDEENCSLKWPEGEKAELEKIKNGISKGESSLIESESGNSMCTNNLVGIEEDFNEEVKSSPKEERADISQIQSEEIVAIEQSKKNKDTFIGEIGDILKEIGTGKQ